jgi:hypothetical protein
MNYHVREYRVTSREENHRRMLELHLPVDSHSGYAEYMEYTERSGKGKYKVCRALSHGLWTGLKLLMYNG